MPNKTTKKQLILEFCQSQGLVSVGAREIRGIEAELDRRLRPYQKTSPAYIANVLRQAGTRVHYDDRYVDPQTEEPYARRLKGLLRFRDLDSTEASLRRLDAVYREYREVSDRVGTGLVRALVLKGKQRAESLGFSSRVSPRKRQEKQEIARWFRFWLETSDLFFDWLELRKEAEEFRRLFANPKGPARKKLAHSET